MIEVVAGIMFKGEKILIARRAPHKDHPGNWEFPGGKIRNNEDPFTALERELREEFGIETRTTKHLITVDHDYGQIAIRLIALFTEYISGEFRLKDHDQIKFVDRKQLVNFELTAADVPVANRLISYSSLSSEDIS